MESSDKIIHKRIEQFNQAALSVDHSQLSIGLYHGKMGLCVYFYELAGLTSEKKYRIAADKMFNDIVNQVSDSIEIDHPNGLSGICMAINFLIEAGYIEGNPNHVLKSFDDKILQLLLFFRLQSISLLFTCIY
ncbi:MAG: hypothetical protein LBE56_07415 [Tannerella sp.]|jgi:lantibiotic modifying enzyme|nr:hypothetical protein [Tannerella sp.]